MDALKEFYTDHETKNITVCFFMNSFQLGNFKTFLS